MRWIRKVRLRVRSLFRSSQVERELDEELRYHLEHLVDDYVAAGLSPPDARSRAVREMGGIEQRKEECREARGLAFVDSLRQDVAYALRALRKTPGFSAVAILSLAVGIGANTTIFTFVNAVLLRPLPYPGAGRLVVLQEHTLQSADPLSVHPVNFMEWSTRARSFEALALVQAPPLNVMGSNGAEQISRLQTTSGLFRVFGVTPALGRWFTEDDTRPGRNGVVVLGHGFWQRWFGGDPSIVGRELALPDGSLTIVGIAPAGFAIGLTEPDALTPMTIDPANPAATGSRAFQCYGRLARGVSLDAARGEMTVIASALRRQYEIDEGMAVSVSGLHEFLARDARPALRLLMAVVATVLVIACVNVAGLLMARGVGRRRELALRAALGASRGRLVRQLVVESFVLSACGGLAGLLMARWAAGGLASIAGAALTSQIAQPIRLDATCLLFTCVASTVTALAFGVAPARRATGMDPESALRDQTRGATGDRRQHRTRSLLVVVQVTLAVVLLVGGGLLLRTLTSLARVNLGFQPGHALTVNLFLGLRPPEARAAVLDEILDRVETVPGVTAAGTVQFLPLSGMTCGTGFWLEEHASGRDAARTLPTECSLVSRGYFAAMGIPVLEGRPFDRRDRIGTPRVVVVNQAFARRYFRGGRVVGRRILVQSSDQALAEIVGVVGDTHDIGLTSDPAPTVFLLHAQTPGYITNLVVRTTGDPLSQAAAIRRTIHEADPTQAVSAAHTLEADLARVLARPRLQAILVACFGAIAVVLAAVGLYALIAYLVTQRVHEIGIRLALGATSRTIAREFLAYGARLVIAGLLIGLAAAVSLRPVFSGFLFGVASGDMLTYLLAVIVFSVAALVAIIVPALNASRVQAVSALRCE